MAPVTRDDEAIQFDAYLDGLIGGSNSAPHLVRRPDVLADDAADSPGVQSSLASSSALVQRALARFHPSFAFEEQLAARLRADADGGPISAVLPFPNAASGIADVSRRTHARIRNGAIASGVSIAGVSLAGAAFLVRRRARPSAARRAGARV